MNRILALAIALLAVASPAAAQSPAQTTLPPPPPAYAPPPPPPAEVAPATAATPPASTLAPATAETPAAAVPAAAAAAAPAAAATPAAAAPAAAATPAAAPAPAAATAPAAAPTPAAYSAPAAAAPPPAATAAAPAAAQSAPAKKPRRLYTWGSVGTTFAYGETYGSVNLGVGLMMKLGLVPNVEVSYAFGASPTLWALRPGVTWFMPVPVLRPFVGAYYTHWYVSDLPDENGVGARLGFSLGPIQLSGTYDRALNCETNCDSWSPQVAFGMSL